MSFRMVENGMTYEIEFWDRSKRLDWFMVRAVVRKIEARPEMLREISECMEQVWGDDPSKARSLRLWRPLVLLSPRDFAVAILADTPAAEEARESFPPYLALTAAERAEFIAASRRQAAVP